MGKLYSYTTDYFKRINTPEKAYWLGLLWADGCLFSKSDKCKQTIISLQKDDEYILEQFKQAIKSNHKIRLQREKYSRLEIYGLEMYDDLTSRRFGLRKSQLNIVPDFPSQFARDFIRGVFDRDGCVYNHNARKQLCIEIAGNESIAKFVFSYFRFGAVSKISNKDTFRWRASGNRLARKFADLIYYDFEIPCLLRKRQKFEVVYV